MSPTAVLPAPFEDDEAKEELVDLPGSQREPADLLKSFISDMRAKMARCKSVEDCLLLLDCAWSAPASSAKAASVVEEAVEEEPDDAELGRVMEWLFGGERPFEEEAVPSLDPDTSPEESESEASTAEFLQDDKAQRPQHTKHRTDSFSTANEEEAIAI
jgi:hypothetical protein